MEDKSPKLPILVCGNSRELLDSREMLLSRSGFRVSKCVPAEALAWLVEQTVHIVVLCHSLSAEERSFLVESVQALAPEATILQLTSFSGSPGVNAGGVMHVAPGPAHLVAACRALDEREEDLIRLGQ